MELSLENIEKEKGHNSEIGTAKSIPLILVYDVLVVNEFRKVEKYEVTKVGPWVKGQLDYDGFFHGENKQDEGEVINSILGAMEDVYKNRIVVAEDLS